ncbi:hypothetical protein M9458_006679, partial [Cirrhinus mrigala]
SQSDLNPNETYKTARRIIKHPIYDIPKFNNDIALVQLSSSLVVNLLEVQRAGSRDGAGYSLE